MVGYMQIGRFAPLSCCWLMLSCILSTYCRRWICKILLKSKALMPKDAYFAKCCAQTMVNGFETKEDSCTDVHIPLHHFSQGVGYITSSQWFCRNFECNRFPGHQVWILNATNFLKNWEASRSRLAMPFNKWLSVTSRVYCSNPAVTLW